MNVNRIILVGALTSEPASKVLYGGVLHVSFDLCTEEVWTDEGGVSHFHEETHRIICWNKLAKSVMEFLGKGRHVYVEGRIRTRRRGDNVTTEVLAETVTLITPKTSEGGFQDELLDHEQPDNYSTDTPPPPPHHTGTF